VFSAIPLSGVVEISLCGVGVCRVFKIVGVVLQLQQRRNTVHIVLKLLSADSLQFSIKKPIFRPQRLGLTVIKNLY